MTDWLLHHYQERNITPAVLTRGYGAKRTEKIQVLDTSTASKGSHSNFGDEPWLLHQHHPNLQFYVSSDRVGASLIAEKKADLLILDDGMQHIRLRRNLNLVLIDCVSGFGNGHLFPLGPLREPIQNLKRADAIIFTRSNLSSSQHLKDQIRGFIPENLPLFDSIYSPSELVNSTDKQSISPSSLDMKDCLLFSGIGNPAAFEKTVHGLGCNILSHFVFSDHQEYNEHLIDDLKGNLERAQQCYAICTEKDWVKLEQFVDVLPTFWVLKMKVEIEEGFEDFLSSFSGL